MRVETKSRIVEGNLGGEVFSLGILDADISFVLSILTDLYKDPELAVIREYSTNARDAHVETGQTRPIEITLPSALSPYFKVKDYGSGLDKLAIANVYSKYGASTKRDTNEQTGMLGLGSKSALTYQDQFTISAVKDGVKTEVSVSRSEDGGGHMEVVDEYETDEPNGVEIIIEAKRYHDIPSKCAEFFKYWPKGTVLVNGEEPASILDDPKLFKITDDLYVTPERYEDTIVMGNVAYPFPEGQTGYRTYSIIAFVPIGSVYFTPNREELMQNKVTMATIKNVIERVEQGRGPAITREVQDAENRRDALVRFHQVKNLFGRAANDIDATYKGTEIPMFSESKDQDYIAVKSTKNKYHREKGWSRENSYSSSLWHKTIWITGYNGADFSPYKRKKMDQWLTEKGLEQPDFWIFCKSTPHRSWLDKTMIHPWEEIAAQKIEIQRTNRPNGTVSGSFEGHVDGDYQRSIQASDIDTKHPIYYINKTYNGWNSTAYQMLTKENPKNTFVEVASNRVAKFKRDFPNAIDINDAIKGLAKAWADKLSDDDKLWLKIRENSSHQYDKLKGLNVDDPDLAEAITLATKTNNTLYNEYHAYSSWLNGTLKEVEWNDPLEKYELLSHLSFYGTMGGVKDHLTLYLNAAYAAEQEDGDD